MVSVHLLVSVAVVACVPQMVRTQDCAGKDGEIVEYTCFSYILCQHGVPTQVDCPGHKVFDPSTKECVDPSAIPWPCSTNIDCSNLADGRYADMERGHCRTYYTCDRGRFAGHNYCPDGLVFNQDLQLCDWDWATPPPCGTAVPSTTTPKP